MRDYFINYYSCEHDAYHLTLKRYIEDIFCEGLIPRCGIRSRSLGDFGKKVCFFDLFDQVYFWKFVLYDKERLDDLILLKFDVKDIPVYIFDRSIGDNAILCGIKNQKILYLNNLRNSLLNIREENDFRLEWYPLLGYKK